MSLIKVCNVVKTYPSGDTSFNALDDVSLTVEKGELIAITGASGSGKSTFMNILGCLDKPSSGSYYLNETNVAELDTDGLSNIRKLQIGFVFQGFNLISRTSLVDNVEIPMIYDDVEKTERRERALDALKMVGLEGREHHMPNQVSGGQQQRAAIARSLVNDPSLILADEPTGNLDTKTSLEMMNLFIRMNELLEKTIIIVTHEPEIAQYCKRIIKFKDGKIISDAQN